MKKSLDWHRKNLTNMVANCNRTYAERERIESDIRRQNVSIELLAKQIHVAEQEGKTEFDEDKYLVRRQHG